MFSVKRQGIDWELHVETSLPKMLWVHNAEAMPIDMVEPVVLAVEGALRDAYGTVSLGHRRRFTRIDLVRDFAPVPDAPQFLSALARDPSYRRTSASEWTSAERNWRGGGKSLYRGPADAKSLLYDKAAEVQVKRYPPDVKGEALDFARERVRFEVQLRKSALDTYAFTRLGDLREDPVLALARNHFEQAQFGATVSSEGDLFDRLGASGLTVQQQCSVWFYLIAAARGRKSGFSANKDADVRALIRKHGFVLGEGHIRPSLRLDFDRGELVEAEALAATASEAVDWRDTSSSER